MKAKSFIQIIHHFRDDALSTPEPPAEKVAIFDEAQRAWTQKMLSKFMSQKKGKQNFSMSEPEFLIRIMDRHIDWAVIICLIGGGQEINTGEAGLLEWFDSLKKDFSNWDVYISDKITDSEYIHEKKIEDIMKGVNYKIIEELHLGVSLRSFRNENVARFIKSILDVEIETARNLCNLLKETYPIFITRDLEKAKETVRGWAKGTERFGIVASSGAKRIRSVGVWVQSKIEAENWFLNGPEDVRSSYFLEDAATEFDIQGLELDWTIMCWDANLRFTKNHFDYYAFKGSKWNSINIKESILYLKNSYRVLLTRARQGMVVFIPHGDASDKTRQSDFYDGTFRYLKDIGLREI
ncbi:MAG: DNA/RNA helicase domain-containing protein [Anaerolineaceae bacterium]|nr:DNA/RNA helicase domain-containing protein [Anaerolineaceae bacterium]